LIATLAKMQSRLTRKPIKFYTSSLQSIKRPEEHGPFFTVFSTNMRKNSLRTCSCV